MLFQILHNNIMCHIITDIMLICILYKLYLNESLYSVRQYKKGYIAD